MRRVLLSRQTKTNFVQETPPSQAPRHIYTVSELTQDIKLTLENTFGAVWVEGEISNFKTYPSGHLYFTIKDEKAALQAVMFGGVNSKEIKFKLEDGLKIICFGRISIYGLRSQYQVIVEKIEPKGIGSLQLAREQLTLKLEKEGLFSPAHKKSIPYLPAKIGIVTSAAGAAIKDILKVLDRRFKDVRIIICPVRVQGEGAKEEISQAIKDFNLYNQCLPKDERIEVMIVGRGGGSSEDLQAFNEEVVARAIYNSRIPIVSAVGHERDVTIADLVADFRVSTPSVAAELVIPKKEDLKEKLEQLRGHLIKAFQDVAINFQETIDDLTYRLFLPMQHALKLSASRFSALENKLSLLNPFILVLRHREKIADLFRQIRLRASHFIKLKESEFAKEAEKLSSLSPLNILGRGYSITFKMPQGLIVKDAKSLRINDTVKTRLRKGEIVSKITGVSVPTNKSGQSCERAS